MSIKKGSKIQSNKGMLPFFKKNQWGLFTSALVLFDLLVFGLSFRIAYFIRFEVASDLFSAEAIRDIAFYQRLAFGFVMLWVFYFIVYGLYKSENLLGGTEEYNKIFQAATSGTFSIIILEFLIQDFYISRAWVLINWITISFVVMFWRFIFRRVIYYLRRRGYFLKETIIVGANDEGIKLAEQINDWESSGLKVVGFIDKKIKQGVEVCDQLKVLGSVDELDEIVKKYEIEEIILATSAISSRDRMVEIFKRFGVDDNINVHFSSGLYEIITTGLTIQQFAFVPLVSVNKVRLAGAERIFKRLADLVGSLIICILFAPLLAGLYVIIRLDSAGNPIYLRPVIGENGRRFNAFKFRTMHVDGDTILENYPGLKRKLQEEHKLKNDPRVTRVGKYLRKFSLDELPQFLNVIKGEMSIVGPRMITESELKQYKKLDTNLQTVKPGITGLWQVSGRSDLSYDYRVELDMYYIRNWTIWLDIQIVIQTIPAVLRSKGAY